MERGGIDMQLFKRATAVILLALLIAVVYIDYNEPSEDITTREPNSWELSNSTDIGEPFDYGESSIDITDIISDSITIGNYTFTHEMLGEMSVEDLHRFADLITILSIAYVDEEIASKMVDTMFIGLD